MTDITAADRASSTEIDLALGAAIRRHEERLARNPSSLAFAQLADLYRKAGRLAEAVAICRDGLVRYPQYATARLILAKALMAADHLEQAAAEAQTILETNAKDVQAHRLAAEIHRRRGHIDVAVRHLETVVKLDHGDREARALVGLLRADPGAGEAGGLGRILSDDVFATVSFGALCLDQGCAEEAVTVFSRILQKDPHHSGARDGLESALRARPRRKG
jgi:tetratricopeptide (TPR) repeat protein